LQGKVQEAMEGYNAVLKRRPSDAPSAAVASNNLITLRGKKDMFDSLKRCVGWRTCLPQK
jgi:signal recognition particle subunit SRP72